MSDACSPSAFRSGTRKAIFNGPRSELTDLVRFWHPRAYGVVIIDTAGPARMRHLEQRLALDGHMAGLVEKAEAEMVEPSRG